MHLFLSDNKILIISGGKKGRGFCLIKGFRRCCSIFYRRVIPTFVIPHSKFNRQKSNSSIKWVWILSAKKKKKRREKRDLTS